MPHGHCYLWEPALVWLQVLSNGAIAAAYVAIFATLVYLVQRIRDIPFQWMYVAFAVFIVACGVTHIFDVVVIWEPAYWHDGAVRALTAVASVGTALMLPPLVPKAIALADAAGVAHARGMKLEEANRELATLLDKTKELEQLKTRFFTNVSHELRTPLALILGPAFELTHADNLTEEQRHAADVVLRNARTLLAHVNDLLDVAKLEAGKLEADYSETDVSALVRDTAAHFNGLAKEHQTTFQVDSGKALPAQVDVGKVERVLVNLLSNAFKFTPRGGAVKCTLTQPAENVLRLEVADSGPGIAKEHRERVFERFQQLEGGITRRFGGTGLGLAIARDFIVLHGGTLTIHDSPLGGALLRAELPRTAPHGTRVRRGVRPSDGPNVATLAASAASETLAALPSERLDAEAPLVLVAEDNLELNRFITSTLAQHWRVAAALNGVEALRLARELHPDLIVTDLMMPEMGGDTLLRKVREDAALSDVPVVVLTAKADDEQRMQLLRDGAHDYILKPFVAEELRIRAGNLISMKQARDTLRAELASQSGDMQQLAQEVGRRRRELQTVMDSLRIARDQAFDASAAKSRFLSSVSHELLTPITTFRLQIERLRKTMPADAQHVLTRLDNSSLRLQQLVESLLDYSRVQSGRFDVRAESTRLGTVAVAALEEMRTQAEQKKLELQTVLPSEELQTTTDPKLVHLIVVNLLANAIKFTAQGTIIVRVDQDAERRRISVEDSGEGIAQSDLARIFEPFEQLEPVQHKHRPGVGLGLAIVRELATALGGEVHVQSVLGKGSVFTLELPAAIPVKSALAPVA